MNLKAQRAAALKAAQDILDTAKGEDRDLTDEETAEIEAKHAEIEELDQKIERATKAAGLVANLAGKSTDDDGPKDPTAGVKTRDVGHAFVASDAFKSFREAHPTGLGSGTPVRIEAKSIGTFEGLLDGRRHGRKATITTDTGQIVTEREPGYRNELPGDEPLTFLDLITSGTTTAAYSEYARIVGETDNAAIVAEGELKPTSDIETALADSKAYTYADGFDITNQTLADDGALAALMESRIQRHVLGVVEQKIFNGSGNGTEPEGIMTTSGTLSQDFDEDVVVTLARALETFETANQDSEPQAIVMNSRDLWNLRLLKDSNGNYLLGNPLQQGPIPTPWGVPLVKSNKLAQGTALVGRFDSIHFLALEALNVLAFNQHKDYAQRNMVYVRAEMRGRQLFYVPREVVVAQVAGGEG